MLAEPALIRCMAVSRARAGLPGAGRLAIALIAVAGKVGKAPHFRDRRIEHRIVETRPEAAREFALVEMRAALALAHVAWIVGHRMPFRLAESQR